jgi:hypothetical protein
VCCRGKSLSFCRVGANRRQNPCEDGSRYHISVP